jgi:rod shape-determining protein MreD
MRYVMFAVIAVVNFIFAGAVFPNLNIAGIAPDIIICSMASIVILEKRMTGAVIGLVCGLLLDMLFSGVIGFYTIPYLLTGAVLYAAVRRISYIDRLFVPMLIAAAAYIFKEMLSGLIIYMLGSEFSLTHMLLRYILPETVATGILMLFYHLLLQRVYRSPSVHPVNPEEFKRL